MTQNFPFSLNPIEESHVHFPITPLSQLLRQDAEHSLLAIFLPQVANRDPAGIQGELVNLYDGRLIDYPVLRIAPRKFIVRLPQYLQVGQVLEDLLLWGVEHSVYFDQYNPNERWRDTPPHFRVHLLIRKYPLEFWNPLYFKQLTASFGSTIYIADQNAKGNDRTSLRLTVQVVDPHRIPRRVVILHEGEWTTCTVILKGWSYEGDPPPNEPGPWRRGSMEDSEFEDPLDVERDKVLRLTLADAISSLNRAMHGQHHEGSHRQSPGLTGRTATPRVAEPDGRRQKSPKERGLCGSYVVPQGRDKWALRINPLVYFGKKDSLRQRQRRFSKIKTLSILTTCLWPQLIPCTTVPCTLLSLRPAPGPPAKCRPGKSVRPQTENRTFHLPLLAKINPNPQKTNIQRQRPSLYLPSILGPPPNYRPPYKNTNQNLSAFPSYQLNHLPLSLASKLKYLMDPEDEALIWKFAGLHTGQQEAETVVSIPLQATTVRNWKLCLVAKVLTDRSVFEAQFERSMRRLWGLYPATTFQMIERGFYLVECTTKAETERMLYEGPWNYRQDLVLIAACTSSKQLNDSKLKEAEVWVQFHGLPADSLTEAGFQLVLSKVGTAISDPLPANQNGKQYHRVKMLISLEKPLRDHVTVRHPALGDVVVHLVYERAGRICIFCGEIGHEIGSCPDRARLAKIRQSNKDSRPELEGILKPTRGVWINNQAMVPIKEGSHGLGHGPVAGDKQKGVAGLKRALIEIISQPAGTSRSHGGLHETSVLNNTEVLLSENEEEEEEETLSSKRVKAARDSPPLPQ